MFRKLFLLSIIPLAALFFSACSDDPTSLGSDLVNQDLVGLDSVNSVPDTSYTYKYIAPQSASEILLLGKSTFDNVTNEASILLNWNIIMPDSIKNLILANDLKVVSSTIELDVSYKDLYYKNNTATPNNFPFTAHKITSGWTSIGFTIDSLQTLTYDPADAIIPSSFNYTIPDTIKFDIDTALAGYWLLAEASDNLPADYGILLKPGNTSGILGFHSLTSTETNRIPLLSVVVRRNSWTKDDTLNFIPAVDLSVVKGDIPADQNEYMYVQSSVMLNSILKFDVSNIPEHAIISYAQLELSMDTAKSPLGSVFSNNMLVSLFSDSTKPDSSIQSNVTLKRSGNDFVGNIAGYVQEWITKKDNKGLLLRTGDVDNGLERFAIRSSRAANPSDRPKLKIIFTNKK